MGIARGLSQGAVEVSSCYLVFSLDVGEDNLSCNESYQHSSTQTIKLFIQTFVVIILRSTCGCVLVKIIVCMLEFNGANHPFILAPSKK